MLRLINKKENFYLKTKKSDENEYYYSIFHDLYESKGIIVANDLKEAAGILLFQFRIPIEGCVCVSKKKYRQELNDTINRISQKFLSENYYYQSVCN